MRGGWVFPSFVAAFARISLELASLDIWKRLTCITATCFVHIVAIIMTAIMILHIRSKYTAVGEFVLGPLSPVYPAFTLI